MSSSAASKCVIASFMVLPPFILRPLPLCIRHRHRIVPGRLQLAHIVRRHRAEHDRSRLARERRPVAPAIAKRTENVAPEYALGMRVVEPLGVRIGGRAHGAHQPRISAPAMKNPYSSHRNGIT